FSCDRTIFKHGASQPFYPCQELSGITQYSLPNNQKFPYITKTYRKRKNSRKIPRRDESNRNLCDRYRNCCAKLCARSSYSRYFHHAKIQQICSRIFLTQKKWEDR